MDARFWISTFLSSFSFHNFLFKNLQLWALDGRIVNSNFSQPTFLSKFPCQTAARMNFGLWMLDSGFLLFLVPFLFTIFYSKTCSCELWIMQNTHPNFALDTHATFLFCIVNIWHVCEIPDTQNGGLLGFAIGRVVCGILKSRDHCAGGVHTTGLIKLCYNQVVEIPNAVPNGLWVIQARIYSWTCMCGMHFLQKKNILFRKIINPESKAFTGDIINDL